MEFMESLRKAPELEKRLMRKILSGKGLKRWG